LIKKKRKKKKFPNIDILIKNIPNSAILVKKKRKKKEEIS